MKLYCWQKLNQRLITFPLFERRKCDTFGFFQSRLTLCLYETVGRGSYWFGFFAYLFEEHFVVDLIEPPHQYRFDVVYFLSPHRDQDQQVEGSNLDLGFWIIHQRAYFFDDLFKGVLNTILIVEFVENTENFFSKSRGSIFLNLINQTVNPEPIFCCQIL